MNITAIIFAAVVVQETSVVVVDMQDAPVLLLQS